MNDATINDEMKNRPESLREETLDQAIDRLAAGENLDVILASSGADAEWMAPLLTLVVEVGDLGKAVPVPSMEASLHRFLEDARQLAPDLPARPVSRRWWTNIQLPTLSFPRMATAFASLMLFVMAFTIGGALFLGTNSTAFAQTLLPGQPLYPAKRLGEAMYLWLPQSSESFNARLIEYAGRRRDEVRALLDRRLAVEVEFGGEIESITAHEIVVSSILAQIVDDTQIEGDLAVGARVLVEAHTTRDGMLIVLRVVVEQPGEQTVVPSPMVAPQSTGTATPAPSVEMTPTQKIPDTATPTPEPATTRQPAPRPTLMPTEDTTEVPEENADATDDISGSDEPGDDIVDDNTDDSKDDAGDSKDDADDDTDDSPDDSADDSVDDDSDDSPDDDPDDSKDDSDSASDDDDKGDSSDAGDDDAE